MASHMLTIIKSSTIGLCFLLVMSPLLAIPVNASPFAAEHINLKKGNFTIFFSDEGSSITWAGISTPRMGHPISIPPLYETCSSVSRIGWCKSL